MLLRAKIGSDAAKLNQRQTTQGDAAPPAREPLVVRCQYRACRCWGSHLEEPNETPWRQPTADLHLPPKLILWPRAENALRGWPRPLIEASIWRGRRVRVAICHASSVRSLIRQPSLKHQNAPQCMVAVGLPREMGLPLCSDETRVEEAIFCQGLFVEQTLGPIS